METKKAETTELSKREIEVLKLTVKGFTASEIAEELNIVRRTVEAHKMNMMNKLSIRKSTKLVAYAHENNLF